MSNQFCYTELSDSVKGNAFGQFEDNIENIKANWSSKVRAHVVDRMAMIGVNVVEDGGELVANVRGMTSAEVNNHAKAIMTVSFEGDKETAEIMEKIIHSLLDIICDIGYKVGAEDGSVMLNASIPLTGEGKPRLKAMINNQSMTVDQRNLCRGVGAQLKEECQQLANFIEYHTARLEKSDNPNKEVATAMMGGGCPKIRFMQDGTLIL